MDIYLCSRNGNGTTNNFQFNGLTIGNHGAEYELTLKNVIFPNLRPTLIKNENNVFTFRHNGVNKQIVFPEDYYDGVTLGTTLQASLLAATGAAYTVAFGLPSAPTYCYAITVPIGNTFEIVNNGDFFLKRFTDLIGMQDQVAKVYPGGSTILGGPVALHGTNFVDLQFRVNQPLIHSGGVDDVIARIPIDRPYGDVINYTPNLGGPTKSFMVGNLVGLQFSLLDEWGNPFRLPSNHSCSIVLSATIAGSSDYAG
jgi:hypothetical protein